jgi:hypothetical protein
MFLGVKPTSGSSPAGSNSGVASGPTADGGMVFADILGMISNPTMSSDDAITAIADATGAQSSDQSAESNIIEKLSGQIVPAWMLGRPGCEAGQPFTNIESNATQPGALSVVAANIGLATAGASSDLLSPLFALSGPILNTSGLNLQSALSADPTELKSGVYEILSSKIHDGTVELTLKSNESTDAIRVSLPLEQLLAGDTGTKPGPQTLTGSSAGLRVPLNQSGQTGNDLSIWFDKLQLSEIRVETVRANPDSKIDNPLKLTLSGTTNIANAGIEIILPSNEVKAFRLNQMSSRFIRHGGNTGGQSGDPNELGTMSAMSPVRPALIAPRVIMRAAVADPSATFTSMFDSTDSFGLAPRNDQTMQTAFPLSDQFKLTGNPAGERIEFGSVRFTLPDKIEQLLQPGGKSVSLKIHPEHLGPARLNLNWSGDGISARVTVDSPVAQLAIERSLDRLHEQLTQAGIKVDHIGVSLSGGQTRGQFANNQSQWQRQSSSFAASSNNDYRDPEFVSATAPAPGGRELYVGSQGVNIFA